MCPVGTATHLAGTLNRDVFNHQVVHLKTLVLGIALSILEQVKKETGTLLGPPALGDAPGLSLSTPAHTSIVHTEGHTLLFSNDILQVVNCSSQSHLLDGIGRLTCVLE